MSLVIINDMSNKYTVIVRNKFDSLQEISKTHTLNEEYENFVNTHMEAASECIPTNPRAKCRVPRESLVVRKKRDNEKIVSLCNKRKPTNANEQRLKKAQRQLMNT